MAEPVKKERPSRKAPPQRIENKNVQTNAGAVALPQDWEQLQVLKKKIDQKVEELTQERLDRLTSEFRTLVDTTALDPAQLVTVLAKEFGMSLGELAEKVTKPRKLRVSQPRVNRRKDPDFEVDAQYCDPDNPEHVYTARKTGRIPTWIVALLDSGKSWSDLRVAAKTEGN